jgi:hypothetical protein
MIMIVNRCASGESEAFVWTKTADEILASIARFAERTGDAGPYNFCHKPSGHDTRTLGCNDETAEGSVDRFVSSRLGVGLIRFGGHLPKGGYDVHNGRRHKHETGTSDLHG